MKTALQPVQASVFGVLNADTALDALLDGDNDGVFDAIPEDHPARKYVLVGESFENQDNTLTENGVEQVLTIHVFVEDVDKQSGNKAAQSIANRLVQLLHGAALTVTGYTAVTCEYDNTQVLPRDGSWRHLVTEFRLLLQES